MNPSVLVAVLLAVSAVAEAAPYPAAPTGDTKDDYFGTTVADPYRGLEVPNAESTLKWLAAELGLTNAAFAANPLKKKLLDRMTALWKYERYDVPLKAGSRVFYTVDDGERNFPVLYVREGDAAPRALVDTNTMPPLGTVALGRYTANEDGSLLAYALTKSGSDWKEWRVRDVVAGKDLPDLLIGIKWSRPAWSKDGKGLFYPRYSKEAMAGPSAEGERVYFHKLGTPQDADVEVFEPGDRQCMSNVQVSDDGKFLIIHVYKGSDGKYVLHVLDLKDFSASDPAALRQRKPVVFGDAFASKFFFIGNEGTRLFLYTSFHAQRGRVVTVEWPGAGLSSLKEIVPESDAALDDASLVGGKLFLSSLRDARTQVEIRSLNGRLERRLVLPGSGTAVGFGGRQSDPETYFSFQDYATPASVYRYDIASGKTALFQAPKLGFDPSAFVSQALFFRSDDGTFVPMTLVHRRDLSLDGSNPVWLYAYGCYGVSKTPTFSVSQIAWMEQGGILAFANIRGGGEYGESWHAAGMKAEKHHSIEDFTAAGQWLIDNHYTSAAHLAIHGASCGGLLAGAALVAKPKLFGAAVVGVGILDLLRYHKFSGAFLWKDELGSSDDAAQFKYLLANSPLHNVKTGVKYPATLVMTADHDTRVVPAHSYKFAAALQAAQAGTAPILLRVEKDAGHGEGMSKEKRLNMSADMLSFMLQAVGRR